jgi:hypothetical protein
MKNYIKPNINIKDILIEDIMSTSSNITKDNGIYDIGTTPNEEL